MHDAAKSLAEVKLATSGLTMSDAKSLKMEFLSAQAVKKLHESFQSFPAIRIPYFDVDGKTPLTPAPCWDQFYRLRYLTTGAKGVAAIVDPAKLPRYAQPPDSGVCAYFPRSVDWAKIRPDPTIPILITEGELKAAKACKEGFPTIGLGGVFNYRSAEFGVMLIRELEAFTWAHRRVTIAFDSDFRHNAMVCKAINELSGQIAERGGLPRLLALPELGGVGKTGLDDFLLVEGADALAALVEGAQALTPVSAFWHLNDLVVYVRDPGLVVVQATNQKTSPAAFKDHEFATSTVPERVVKDARVSMKPVSAAALWLKWPPRFEVGRLTYAPGQPRVLPPDPPRRPVSAWNAWSGWGAAPEPGDAGPFLALIDHLFAGAEPESPAWFMRWLAWPVKNPGAKLFTSAVLHGVRHGTGKSLVGYTMGKIYGSNFAEITGADLHSNFNEWAEAKQFVLADDVTGGDRRRDADVLKKMITQKELRVNPKYVASYVVPDCVNYLFTSNHPDAFFLEDDDRRFFVHEIEVGPLPEMFYVDYDLWLSAGGAAHVHHHLLNLDLAGFNPSAPAFRTKARDRMISDSQSDLGGWVRRLRDYPEDVLVVGGAAATGDLFTNRQLLAMYDPGSQTGTTANGLGRELKRAGFRQVNGGKPVNQPSGGVDRLYAVRGDRDHWARARLDEVTAHLATANWAPDAPQARPPRKPRRGREPGEGE